jgi:hypothetical protein
MRSKEPNDSRNHGAASPGLRSDQPGPPPLTGPPPANELPEVVEKLERLDDVIFPAIDGDVQALEACEPAWRETVAELGHDAVAESRAEYLRYARSVWQFLSSQAVAHPLRILAVLKIMGLLVGDDV